VALTAFRVVYFGAPLPNTFYAKRIPQPQALLLGLRYLLRTLSIRDINFKDLRAGHLPASDWIQFIAAPVFWGLLAIGVARAFRDGRGRGGPALDRLVLIAPALACAIAVLRAGGDWMPGWRFMAPALPTIALLQTVGVEELSKWISRRALIYVAVAVVWLGAIAAVPWNPWTNAGLSTHDDALLIDTLQGYGTLWTTMADYIHRTIPYGASVAYTEVGYAGWINPDKSFLDPNGLTDFEIAHRFGSPDHPTWSVPGDPYYQLLRRRKPDYIIIVNGLQGIFAQSQPDVVLQDWKLMSIVSVADPIKDRQRRIWVYQYLPASKAPVTLLR